jgi:hypothetical protein
MRWSGALHWPQPPRHTICTAAAPHPSLQGSVGLQLQQITAIGTDKALLADVTEAHPDASYIELLRPFKVRRSVADGHSQRACCIVSAFEHLLAAAAPDPLFGSTLLVCLFVCLLACLFAGLLVCLFVCLFVCDGPLQNTPSMARPTPHARRRVVMAYSRLAAGVRFACTGALPPTPPSRCRTSALHQCVCVE